MSNPYIWASESDLSGPGPKGIGGLIMASEVLGFMAVGFWLAYGETSPLRRFFKGKDVTPFLFSFGIWPAAGLSAFMALR